MTYDNYHKNHTRKIHNNYEAIFISGPVHCWFDRVIRGYQIDFKGLLCHCLKFQLRQIFILRFGHIFIDWNKMIEISLRCNIVLASNEIWKNTFFVSNWNNWFFRDHFTYWFLKLPPYLVILSIQLAPTESIDFNRITIIDNQIKYRILNHERYLHDQECIPNFFNWNHIVCCSIYSWFRSQSKVISFFKQKKKRKFNWFFNKCSCDSQWNYLFSIKGNV